MTPIRSKDKPIQLRVSDEERDKLKALAEAQGLSIAAYIRWALLYNKQGGEK
jgi:predicted DNA binding CopG/RHH family protein